MLEKAIIADHDQVCNYCGKNIYKGITSILPYKGHWYHAENCHKEVWDKAKSEYSEQNRLSKAFNRLSNNFKNNGKKIRKSMEDSMNKSIRTNPIVKNDVTRIGRFTIVELTDEKGYKGIGISRRSQLDKENKLLAESIAKGRAERALALKKEKKSLRNIFMG